MAKAFRKKIARLQARQAHYDALPAEEQKTRKRPGSMKKPHPLKKR